MIKAVFFDIDGTLLSFKTHTISSATSQALQQLKKQGTKVFVASGRSFEQVKKVLDFPFDGYITSNGSCCLTADGSLLEQATLPKQDLHNLVSYLRADKAPFSLSYMTGTGIYANHWSEALCHHFDLINVQRPVQAPLENLLSTDVFQLTIYVGDNVEKILMERIMPNCEFTRWHELFADVNNKLHNKATGIRVMLNHHGIDLRETMAFGDGGNDLKMLQYVEHGVAMGNAGSEIKTKARYVTDSVDEDGVWNALVRLNVLHEDVYHDQ